MAATLLEIKSRAMLPRPPKEEDGTDPETELIRRLEEYKRFRETAESMKAFEEASKRVFTKLPEEYPLPPQEFEELIRKEAELSAKNLSSASSSAS
jgi:segregation and condensation protein A